MKCSAIPESSKGWFRRSRAFLYSRLETKLATLLGYHTFVTKRVQKREPMLY